MRCSSRRLRHRIIRLSPWNKPCSRTREMLIAAFVIGMLILMGKIGWIAVKAAWGILKVLLFILFLPAILVVLFVVGSVKLAIPLLIIALLAAFIGPLVKD